MTEDGRQKMEDGGWRAEMDFICFFMNRAYIDSVHN
jgi:hypothetical protein